MTPRDEIRKELDQIMLGGGGVLYPEAVVEFARDEATALHGQFTWDDSEAAHQYRLWQARQVIRVHVLVHEQTTEPVRAYVSLGSDRKLPGGGYRPFTAVMNNEQTREELLSQARAEFLAWRRRYEHLKRLEPIFSAAEQVFERKPAAKTPANAIHARV